MARYKVDRQAVKVSSLDENDEKDYWRSKTPIDRLRAIEINRRIVYGHARTSARIQRFLEVVKFPKRRTRFS